MASIAEQLVEMGFEAALADEAAKNNMTLDTAMDWLVSRQEKAERMDTTDAAAAPQEQEAAAVASSYKCNDCGKLMKDDKAMMFHASKTGHENFDESTESIKPLTEEEKIEQAAKLKQRIKESLKNKAALEEKEKIEREKRRVQDGKLMLERNEKRKEMEQLAAIAQRKKDKEEEEAARKRVLDQIRADREARKGAAAPAAPSVPSKPQPPAEKKDYKEATIQVRLPSGEMMRHTFGAQEQLSAVRLWVEMSRPDLAPFALLQPFPRKTMTDADMEAPLSAHGLVPSGSLVVTRAQ